MHGVIFMLLIWAWILISSILVNSYGYVNVSLCRRIPNHPMSVADNCPVLVSEKEKIISNKYGNKEVKKIYLWKNEKAILFCEKFKRYLFVTKKWKSDSSLW